MDQLHLAIDQYGDKIILHGAPRKALLEHFSRKHAEHIYVDSQDGMPKHIGWIVAGHWFTIFHLERMDNVQS